MDELQLVRDFFGEPPPPDPAVVAAARARMSARGPAVRRGSVSRHLPARGWMFPLAAATSVVVIVLASVFVAHLAGTTRTPGGTATMARAPRPEFYMTATYPASGPHVLQLQVRRTAGGAVTASTSIPAASLGWGGTISAAAGDRAFFIGHYPCLTTEVTATTLYRIAISGSGRISGIAAVGRVRGMVGDLAVSPDGSQLAYNALPGKCGSGSGSKSPAAVAVSILDLSTGAVRTWRDPTQRNTVGQAGWSDVVGLSWAPDGRTLIIDEVSHGLGRPALTVFGLDTASSGGSLRGHSKTLLRQNYRCSKSSPTCVGAVLAGPDDSLTALESQVAGQQARLLVVRIPLAAGRPRTVLYSELSDMPVRAAGLAADPSGQWVLLWPAGGASPQPAAGWISGGRLHPLPGVAQVFPQGIAW